MSAHIVKNVDHFTYEVPSEFAGRSSGYTTVPIVDEPGGGVQMGFRVASLAGTG
jgi:hypothetical protein